MSIDLKTRYKFEVSGKEFNQIIRGLKKIKNNPFAAELLDQRIKMVETLLRQSIEAREMCIELHEGSEDDEK